MSGGADAISSFMYSAASRPSFAFRTGVIFSSKKRPPADIITHDQTCVAAAMGLIEKAVPFCFPLVRRLTMRSHSSWVKEVPRGAP